MPPCASAQLVTRPRPAFAATLGRTWPTRSTPSTGRRRSVLLCRLVRPLLQVLQHRTATGTGVRKLRLRWTRPARVLMPGSGRVLSQSRRPSLALLLRQRTARALLVRRILRPLRGLRRRLEDRKLRLALGSKGLLHKRREAMSPPLRIIITRQLPRRACPYLLMRTRQSRRSATTPSR